MIALAAVAPGVLEIVLVLALIGGVLAVVRPSVRKAGLLVLGFLVAGVMFMRVSTVHYAEQRVTPAVVATNDAGDSPVDESMDVERPATPAVSPSVRQAAQSLVVRAAPQGFQPERVRLFASASIPEPMRQAVLLALGDRYPNANVILVTSNYSGGAPADRELNFSLQITSSYTRGYNDRTTRGWRYELTAFTNTGRTAGTVEHQENEIRRGPAEHATHVRVYRTSGVKIIGTLALILLLYLGLNAWTRGYFQTRLRFLAAALFLLGIVVVMLLA